MADFKTYVKENADWLLPTGAALISFLTFGLSVGNSGWSSILTSLLVGAAALITGQAFTETGLLKPDSTVRNWLQDKLLSTHQPGELGPRFDRLLEQTLKEKDGIFLGEAHNRPAVIQSVTQLLPSLKALGVRTISLEQPQEVVDLLSDPQNLKDLAQRNPQWEKTIHNYSALVIAAKKLDLKVLGHEVPQYSVDPNDIKEVIRDGKKVHTIDLQALKRSTQEEDTSYEGIKKRNELSADYIKQNKIGKVIVIGGNAHSGDITERIFFDKPLRGLDKLLGVPSIDYELADDSIPAGMTIKTDGKYNDYTVRLPKEIPDVSKTDWLTAPVTPTALPKNTPTSAR